MRNTPPKPCLLPQVAMPALGVMGTCLPSPQPLSQPTSQQSHALRSRTRGGPNWHEFEPSSRLAQTCPKALSAAPGGHASTRGHGYMLAQPSATLPAHLPAVPCPPITHARWAELARIRSRLSRLAQTCPTALPAPETHSALQPHPAHPPTATSSMGSRW